MKSPQLPPPPLSLPVVIAVGLPLAYLFGSFVAALLPLPLLANKYGTAIVWSARAMGGLCGFYGSWRLRRSRAASIALGGLGWLLLPFGDAIVHVTLGTPITECRLPLPQASECIGRNRTLMQGRWLVERAHGVLPVATCQALLARPPLSADQQEPPSEAVEACDVDHPQSWTLGECADGIDSRSFACVVCVRMLETNDHEVFRLTVARDGTGVTLERATGLELADLQSALRR